MVDCFPQISRLLSNLAATCPPNERIAYSANVDAAIDVVGRVGALLRAVSANEPDGATTSALARQVRLARPTVHRLLTSMIEEGLTDRDNDSGRWHLGPEMYLFGLVASHRHDATEI